jgi:hypothetical protein
MSGCSLDTNCRNKQWVSFPVSQYLDTMQNDGGWNNGRKLLEVCGIHYNVHGFYPRRDVTPSGCAMRRAACRSGLDTICSDGTVRYKNCPRFQHFTPTIHLEIFLKILNTNKRSDFTRRGALNVGGNQEGCFRGLATFKSWRWSHCGTPKRWYTTTLLHGVITQKDTTWILTASFMRTVCKNWKPTYVTSYLSKIRICMLSFFTRNEAMNYQAHRIHLH